VNLANELCKITFSKLSVKSFIAKPLSDHLSDLTTHPRHRVRLAAVLPKWICLHFSSLTICMWVQERRQQKHTLA